MVRPEDQKLDASILTYLAVHVATAWAISGSLGISRERASARLQSMKRRGLVETVPGFSAGWRRMKPLEAA